MAKAGARRVTNPDREAHTVGGTDKGRTQEVSRGMSTDTAAGRVNKRDLIRLAIGNHPQANPEKIVEILLERQVRVSRALVEEVQSEMRGGGKATGKQGGGQPKGEKGKKAGNTLPRRTRADDL